MLLFKQGGGTQMMQAALFVTYRRSVSSAMDRTRAPGSSRAGNPKLRSHPGHLVAKGNSVPIWSGAMGT